MGADACGYTGTGLRWKSVKWGRPDTPKYAFRLAVKPFSGRSTQVRILSPPPNFNLKWRTSVLIDSRRNRVRSTQVHLQVHLRVSRAPTECAAEPRLETISGRGAHVVENMFVVSGHGEVRVAEDLLNLQLADACRQ